MVFFAFWYLLHVFTGKHIIFYENHFVIIKKYKHPLIKHPSIILIESIVIIMVLHNITISLIGITRREIALTAIMANSFWQ